MLAFQSVRLKQRAVLIVQLVRTVGKHYLAKSLAVDGILDSDKLSVAAESSVSAQSGCF